MSEMDRLVDVQVRPQHLVAYSPVLMLIMLALIGCIGQGGSGESVLFPVRKWLLVNVSIVVLYLPWLPNFIRQASGMKGLEWIPPTTWDMLPGLVSQYTVMISASEGGLWASLIVSALMIICSVLALGLWRDDQRVILLLIGYFFVPVITLFFCRGASRFSIPGIWCLPQSVCP